MNPKNPPTASHTAELQTWLAHTLARCRTARWFGAAALVGVACDIAADLRGALERLRRRAYSAEQHIREAMRLRAAAQAPDSPGGPAITPAEDAPISRLLQRAANETSEISSAAP